MNAEIFQRIFDDMTPLKTLPDTALEGDLAKTEDKTAWVWTQGRWIKLDEGMRLIYDAQP